MCRKIQNLMSEKILVFIPTFNEAANVERIFQQIIQLHLNTDILFLDDNSPDGTGKIIDKIASQFTQVSVIHRAGKLGIGSAHKEGIQYAYEHNYDVLITMDCDFSHSPNYISDFIKNKNEADIVVGSRYIKKNSIANWSLLRQFLMHLGHFLTVTILKMPYDASGAFRLYNLNNIDKNIFSLVRSNGYSFFFESLFIIHFNKKRIFETPIVLPSRLNGSSKMTFRDALKSLEFLFTLFIRKAFNKKSLLI